MNTKLCKICALVDVEITGYQRICTLVWLRMKTQANVMVQFRECCWQYNGTDCSGVAGNENGTN